MARFRTHQCFYWSLRGRRYHPGKEGWKCRNLYGLLPLFQNLVVPSEPLGSSKLWSCCRLYWLNSLSDSCADQGSARPFSLVLCWYSTRSRTKTSNPSWSQASAFLMAKCFQILGEKHQNQPQTFLFSLASLSWVQKVRRSQPRSPCLGLLIFRHRSGKIPYSQEYLASFVSFWFLEASWSTLLTSRTSFFSKLHSNLAIASTQSQPL